MNDLISRRALCDFALNQRDKTITPNDIMRFPAADPVKHGKWEQSIVDGYGGRLALITCSVCHTSGIGGLPYCPYCGARMDGEKV